MLLLFSVWRCFVCSCVCVSCTCLVPLKARKGFQVPLGSGVRWLWATMWVLCIKPGSSRRAAVLLTTELSFQPTLRLLISLKALNVCRKICVLVGTEPWLPLVRRGSPWHLALVSQFRCHEQVSDCLDRLWASLWATLLTQSCPCSHFPKQNQHPLCCDVGVIPERYISLSLQEFSPKWLTTILQILMLSLRMWQSSVTYLLTVTEISGILESTPAISSQMEWSTLIDLLWKQMKATLL